MHPRGFSLDHPISLSSSHLVDSQAAAIPFMPDTSSQSHPIVSNGKMLRIETFQIDSFADIVFSLVGTSFGFFLSRSWFLHPALSQFLPSWIRDPFAALPLTLRRSFLPLENPIQPPWIAKFDVFSFPPLWFHTRYTLLPNGGVTFWVYDPEIQRVPFNSNFSPNQVLSQSVHPFLVSVSPLPFSSFVFFPIPLVC